MGARPVVNAIVSDTHGNSTTALCPPEGVRLDDGGKYRPSRAQLWLWECWEDYWATVAAIVKRLRADLYVEVNGDATEGGAHHGTTQIISANPEAQAYVIGRIFGVPKAQKPKRIYIMRGTDVHVGPSGASEEALAQHLGAVRNPETETWSWWHLRLKVQGVRFDFQHHGRMGQRPWTRQNVVSNLAAQIFYEHASRNLEHPHVAIRSHYHQHQDTFNAHPVRVIQTPAWQLKTAHAHKVVADSLADIGGLIITVQDGAYEVQNKLYHPELPTWQE